MLKLVQTNAEAAAPNSKVIKMIIILQNTADCLELTPASIICILSLLPGPLETHRIQMPGHGEEQ